VAGNHADVSGPDLFGEFSSGGYNLVGVGDGSFGLSNGTNQDQVGSGGSPIAPLLGPLADNGGPTLTVLPLTGSPAIDKGFAGGVTTDQRLRARVFDDGAVANAAGGDGSDVGACERGAGTVDVSPGPPTVPATGALADRIDEVTPDPAVGVFRVRFSLVRAGATDLALFDVAGRQVAILARGLLAAGSHEVAIVPSGTRVRSGVYWLRLAGPSSTSVRRVVQLP